MSELPSMENDETQLKGRSVSARFSWNQEKAGGPAGTVLLPLGEGVARRAG